MLAHETLQQLTSLAAFQPTGEPAGNLTLGRGTWKGVAVHVALVENRIASGSLGVKECDKLASLFKVVAVQKTPLLLYLDSAGARVSEGLPALGAFRRMYAAALRGVDAGAAFAAVCGANCFGGASMLASLASVRYFSANTRFAMSGPAILAQSAGVSVLDEMFLAMSHAAIGGEARAKLVPDNFTADEMAELVFPIAPIDLRIRHADLGARLATVEKPRRTMPAEKIERNDLARLYPDGYRLVEQDGIVSGEATVEGAAVTLLGTVNGRLIGAAQAHALATQVWALVNTPPMQLHMLIDCESHATSLEDERVMLSAYIADLASALAALVRTGTRIETTVLGKLGGGVYVALTAPSVAVNLLYGKEIQLLPGKAIASILGDAGATKFEFAEYLKAGVAEREIKLGLT